MVGIPDQEAAIVPADQAHVIMHFGYRGCFHSVAGGRLLAFLRMISLDFAMDESDDANMRLPPLPIMLECMSWPQVQYLMSQDALRFDYKGFEGQEGHDFKIIPQNSRDTFLCIATHFFNSREVVGYLHYEATDTALHYCLIRVHKDFEGRAIGTRMALEVLLHPTTVLSATVSYTAINKYSQRIRRHLERLSDQDVRLCGTPFRLFGVPFADSIDPSKAAYR